MARRFPSARTPHPSRAQSRQTPPARFVQGPGWFVRHTHIPFPSGLDLYPQPDLFSSGIGTNIFFSTPLLVIFLSAPQGKTSHTWLRNTLWITVTLMLITVLLYCTTGWVQVGSRYLFGFYPLLFLLLAQRAAPLD